MSEARLFKVSLDHPESGATRDVTVQARTEVQSQDAASKLMQPGERIVAVETIKGPVARHLGVPPGTTFPGTQTHPDDPNA